MTVWELSAQQPAMLARPSATGQKQTLVEHQFESDSYLLARQNIPMKITSSEREALLGPTVVGILAGAFSAFCVVAFDSDYGGTIQVWQRVLRTVLGFFGGFLAAFGPFGLLPILVARLMRRNRSS